MEETQRKLSPFLQGALEKDESERSFLERMAVNIYGPILEADEDRNKPAAVLDENYKDFVSTLPADVQLDVDRYLNIFRNDPTPVIEFINEYKDKGYSDYFKDSKNFTDIADKKDLGRYADYNYLGGGAYDALYRKDDAGD